ncbi:hypothetical protein V8B97DRAFT_2025113 [Scleroderma yunnanense]
MLSNASTHMMNQDHKCIIHLSFNHSHQSFPEPAGLLGGSGQEGHDTSHAAADNSSHQGEGVLHQEHEGVRVEFVAQKCDTNGHFLPDDAPPPPHAQKLPDNWTPYHNQLKFELADSLSTNAELPVKKIDMLLEIWATSWLALGGEPLFTNHTDLHSTINSTDIGNKVIQNILMCAEFTDEMDFVPYHEYDATTNERHWQDFIDDLTITGLTLIPIILSSNKTTVSVATGQMDYYPLYLSIGNVHNCICHGHNNAIVLIMFLAMPKTTREHANTPEFHKFKQQLFHSSLTCILHSLHPTMEALEVILFGDGYYWHVIYALAAYIADYEKQVLHSCIMQNWCPKCLAHQDNLDETALCHHQVHADAVITEFELCKLWEMYGIVGDLPFMNDFLHVDIHQMLSQDIHHQLIKGGFKDHLVDWVEKYLIHIHRTVRAEKVLDEIDQWIGAVHFKQWTSDDSKGYVPSDVVHTFQAFLPCKTLVKIDDVLRHFHLYHKVFSTTSVVNTFSLPQQHLMKHYHHLICQYGAPNGLCSSITKPNGLDKAEAAMASYKEKVGETVDTPMVIDMHVSLSILECKHAKNVEALTVELDMPQRHPLNECLIYNSKLHVFNSACSMFFAPSDLSDFLGTEYPCDDVHWFDHVGDGPDEETGMWIVCPDLKPHYSYDMFHSFYVIKFADHHAFEIAF